MRQQIQTGWTWGVQLGGTMHSFHSLASQGLEGTGEASQVRDSASSPTWHPGLCQPSASQSRKGAQLSLTCILGTGHPGRGQL